MPESSQGTVLLVDDEDELRFVLSERLRSVDFKVLQASDGPEAVRLAQEHLPDVVIMDITLPGMDGISATRELKKDDRTAGIPVIMLTARSRPEDVVRGLEAGAQEYIGKPFDMTEFLARVRTVFRLTSARRDLDRLTAQLEAEIDAKTRSLRLLYEFMRDLNHTGTRSKILDLLMQSVSELTGAKRISLLMVDEAGEYLRCERAAGIKRELVKQIRMEPMQGITEEVFDNGNTLAVRTIGKGTTSADDYARETIVNTPILSSSLQTQSGTIGVLNVSEKPDGKSFSDDEIDCIRSITDAAAIALENIIQRTRLQESVRVLLQTVGHLSEYRDEETTLHLERVSYMARVLADELRREGPYASLINDEFVEHLVYASPLHDIGKVGIPDDILTKPGKLTDEEFQIMKTHTDIGRRVLSNAVDPSCPNPLLQMCIDIAYCHHERFNGKGYPRRIAGDDIPLSARIITLVDAYDAITSRRRYKKEQSHEEAVSIIREESGKHFDPVIVDAFLRCQERFEELRGRFEDESDSPAPALSS